MSPTNGLHGAQAYGGGKIKELRLQARVSAPYEQAVEMVTAVLKGLGVMSGQLYFAKSSLNNRR